MHLTTQPHALPTRSSARLHWGRKLAGPSLSLLLACLSFACSDEAEGGSGAGGQGGAASEPPLSGEGSGGDKSGGGTSSGGDAATGGAAADGTGASSAGGSGGDGSGGDGSGGDGSGGDGSGGDGSGGTPNDPDVPATAYCSAAADWAHAAEEEEFLTLINALRAKGTTCKSQQNGMVVETVMPAVGPLSFDPLLRCTSRLHSQDMHDRDYFSHATWNASAATCATSLDCSTDPSYGSGFICDDENGSGTKRCGAGPRLRIEDAGGSAGGWAENIAAGNGTAAGAIAQWEGSTSGHCQAMMGEDRTLLGIGLFSGANGWKHYWTMLVQ